MKMYIGLFLLSTLTLGLSNKLVHNRDKIVASYSVVDVLIENIKNEKWRDEDMNCYNEILRTFENSRNSTLWASWVLDSMQLPTGVLYGSKYQLGNYDECMEAPWTVTHLELRTKYCLADVQLNNVDPKQAEGDFDPYGSTEMYINSLTKHARKLNTITWGVCVPSTCSLKAVSIYLKALLRSSSLSSTSSNPHIIVGDCQIAGKSSEASVGVKVFLYLILSLLVIATTSTWYLASKDCEGLDSFGTKLAKSFCMNRNAYDLVKPSREDIPVLHGMRVLTAIIMAFTHQVFFVNSGAVSNGLNVDKDLDMAFFMIHTDLFTDTFLLMSGLLLAKGIATKEKLENPLSMLWKRYIRLIGPMALLVFYLASVSLHTGSGPLWPRLAGFEQKMCANHWWLSLIMLNNYIKSEEMCFITLWYIPTDYHLTVLGIALIYTYRAHRRMGMVTVAAVTVLALLLPAIATYWWRLPATIIYNVETMINIRGNANFNSTYIKSHYRIGSYLVGLGVGSLMAVYKPNLHRNCISKKLSILVFSTAFIVAWVPMSLGGVFYTREYSPVEAAVYAATNRIVWVLALSALVVVSEYGELPIVNGLMSWTAWVPLSRLSYGLYLTHPVIILYNVFSARSPLRNHAFTMLSDSFGPIVLGYIFSLMIWLLVQAPISNLTTYLHRKPAQELKQDLKQIDLAINGVCREGIGEKVKSL